MDNTKQGVSIIIPTLNRQECIQNTVRDLLAQKTDISIEIIIVDQSEFRDTNLLNFISNIKLDVKYFHVSFRGLPLARNFGLQRAKFNIIAYVDDDVIIPENYIAELWKSFLDKNISILAGGIDEVYRKDNPNPTETGRFNFWTATASRDFNSDRESYVYSAPGGNFSVRREVFEKIFGFDEELAVGAALYEESEFCLRAIKNKFKIWFNPKVRLKHLAHPTGGCRVPEIPNYVWSLSRNRMFLIMRYLKWFHLPTAMGRLLLLIVSYTRTSLNPMTVVMGITGIYQGINKSLEAPKVTKFEEGIIKYQFSSTT